MSSLNAKPPEKSDLAKRMLEDLAEPVRAEIKPVAKPAPVVRAVEPAAEIEEQSEVRENREPARREPRRKTSATVQRKLDVEISTGQGTRHLTLRVPKDLAGDLSMLAMKNKLEENGQPTTINDLGIQALRRLLNEAA
jgi:hypothetical protein